MGKAALVAWVVGKQEREVEEEEEQVFNIGVMEMLELERREEEKFTAIGEQIVDRDEEYLEFLVQRKDNEQLEEDEDVFLEYLEEEQRANDEMAEELNEDCDFLLQYCVDNVGPDKDSSFQEVEEMLAELEEEEDKYDAMVASQEQAEEREESHMTYLLKFEEQEDVKPIKEDKHIYTVSVPFTDGTVQESNRLESNKGDKDVFINEKKYLYTGNEEIPWEASDRINPMRPLYKEKQPSSVSSVKTKTDGARKDIKTAKFPELTEVTIESMRKKVAQEGIEEDDGIEIVTTVSRGYKAFGQQDSREREIFRRQKMGLKRKREELNTSKRVTQIKTDRKNYQAQKKERIPSSSSVRLKRERSESPEVEVLDQPKSNPRPKTNKFLPGKKQREQTSEIKLPPGFNGRIFPNAQIFPNAIIFGTNHGQKQSEVETGPAIPAGVRLIQGQAGQRGGSGFQLGQRSKSHFPGQGGANLARQGSNGGQSLELEARRNRIGTQVGRGVVSQGRKSENQRHLRIGRGQTEEQVQRQKPITEKRDARSRESVNVDSGFQNIIAAAFANIPQGKPASSRPSKKLALGKLVDPQGKPSLEKEKAERKKLDKFIAENVRKAAIVTAEGRWVGRLKIKKIELK